MTGNGEVQRRSNGRIDNDEDHRTNIEDGKIENLPDEEVKIKDRLEHVTWANFTLPMSTGGIALLLSSTPHRFPGLRTIGVMIYIFDIVVFLALVGLIIHRFLTVKPSLLRSLRHPTEALFFPTFWLSLQNILSAAADYGLPSTGPWLVVALRVCFWIYVACTFLLAVAQYWYLFTAPASRLTVQSMTPAWLLPVFPLMLSGTFASAIASSQPAVHRMPVIVAGITFQGLGWMVSFLMYSAFITRLMQYGLPAPNLRPGMFIAVGPPSFTALALIGMSKALPGDYGYFAAHPDAVTALQQLALFVGIFLWALAFWFFCIALVSVLAGARKMTFHLVWWALVFPNVGFTIATIDIGHGLMDSPGVLWVGSAMTIMLVAVWLVVLVSEAAALYRKEIWMPGMDEDKDQYKVDDEKHGISMPYGNEGRGQSN